MQSQYTGEFPTFPNTREHIASYFQNVVDWITPTRPQNYIKITRFQWCIYFFNQINYLPISLKEKVPIQKKKVLTKLTIKQKEALKKEKKEPETDLNGNVIVPRYDCVTTHTTRRTSITNMYLSYKFTIVQMMHVSGHKIQKTFMDYIKLSSEE